MNKNIYNIFSLIMSGWIIGLSWGFIYGLTDNWYSFQLYVSCGIIAMYIFLSYYLIQLTKSKEDKKNGKHGRNIKN